MLLSVIILSCIKWEDNGKIGSTHRYEYVFRLVREAHQFSLKRHSPDYRGGERGVVPSCSYKARRFGVRSAMPIHMAMKLCPQAKVKKGDMELYSRLSHDITEIIQEKAPVVEKASIDEFYLDITGMDKFHGSYKWTNELAQTIIKETGLPLTFALSINKTVSKIGTGKENRNRIWRFLSI